MLALVPYLQGNDGVPVNEVAAEFGVTPKVIRDDLRLLMYTGTGEYAGELIDFDLTALERDGIVHIRDAEFMTRPLRISAREGIALIVALRTLRASAIGAELTIIDNALAKLESAVGGSDIAPVDVLLDDVDPDIRATIGRALADHRRLAITYATATRDEQTEREVDPRRMVTAQGKLYLEAWCLRAQDLRFFRLDRVLAAEVTDQHAEQHDDVQARDLAEGFFTIGDDNPHVLVDLHPRAHWLTEYYQVDLLEESDDGIWRAKIYGADWAWLRRLVLRNAGSVAVIEPGWLREQVVADAALALQAYDGDVTPNEES